jgi:Na+-transporting methylmalonyl-CoA/oxaloacetate decarboxylase gamma subunit
MDRLVSAAGFGVVLVGLIIVAVVIITLGRLKPRLGQPIARSRSQV